MQGQVGTGLRRGQPKIWAIEARMKADMGARGHMPLTQRVYVRAVRHPSRHYAHFSTSRPGTRSNSRTFSVASRSPWARHVAANQAS